MPDQGGGGKQKRDANQMRTKALTIIKPETNEAIDKSDKPILSFLIEITCRAEKRAKKTNKTSK